MDGALGKCHTCGREGVYYSMYLKQSLCKKHLEKMLVRRIRGALISRSYKQKRFRTANDGSAAHKMISFVFKIDPKSSLTLRNGTLEDFAISVLRYFMEGRKPTKRVGSKTFFNPLYTTSEDEVYAFLDSKRVVYKRRQRKGKDRYMLDFIGGIEARRPGGMLSLVKIGERLGLV